MGSTIWKNYWNIKEFHVQNDRKNDTDHNELEKVLLDVVQTLNNWSLIYLENDIDSQNQHLTRSYLGFKTTYQQWITNATLQKKVLEEE